MFNWPVEVEYEELLHFLLTILKWIFEECRHKVNFNFEGNWRKNVSVRFILTVGNLPRSISMISPFQLLNVNKLIVCIHEIIDLIAQISVKSGDRMIQKLNHQKMQMMTSNFFMLCQCWKKSSRFIYSSLKESQLTTLGRNWKISLLTFFWYRLTLEKMHGIFQSIHSAFSKQSLIS